MELILQALCTLFFLIFVLAMSLTHTNLPFISAVILPTLNEYVETFTEETFYLGLILASFSLSGLLVAPIFGVFHDKLRKTKAMLLFANLFEIVGK